MSQFLRHEACPNCRDMGLDRAGDNLGVWSDHKWCFSCGYFEGKGNSLNLQEIWEKLNKKKRKERGHLDIVLPSDFTYSIPSEPLTWLQKYGITDREILQNRIGWSDGKRQLLFPVFDLYGNLVFYQGRSFDVESSDVSKYDTRGRSESVYHILGAPSNGVVIVEDIVSAIKVARVQQAMPLWGSQIAPERIKTLSERFERLWIWLDKDKANQSVKTRIKASPFFDEVTNVVTEKDPKCYDEKQIEAYLYG